MNTYFRLLCLLLMTLPLGAQAHEPESLTLVTLADGNRGTKNTVDLGGLVPHRAICLCLTSP